MSISRPDVEQWRQAIEQGWFGVWDLDTRQETVHYSPRWKEHLGFPYARSADHTAFWRCRVHPDDQAQMLSAMQAYLDGRLPSYEAKFRLRSNGSGYRLMHSRGVVLERDVHGNATRMVGTMVDLSERPASPAGRLLVEDAAAMPRLQISADRPFHQLLDDLQASNLAPLGIAGQEPLLGVVAGLLDRSLRQVSVKA